MGGEALLPFPFLLGTLEAFLEVSHSLEGP